MAFSSSEYAISTGSLILVTGANSYIATHIIDLLLELGYNVRGTVRAERPWLNEYFEQKYGQGRYKTVLVQKMEEPGAFDDYLRGVAGVIHVVSTIHQVVPQLPYLLTIYIGGRSLFSNRSEYSHSSHCQWLLECAQGRCKGSRCETICVDIVLCRGHLA